MIKETSRKTNISEKAKKVARVGLAVGAVAMAVIEAPASAHETHKAGAKHEHKYSIKQLNWLTSLRLNTGQPVTGFNGTLFHYDKSRPGGVKADPNQVENNSSGGMAFLEGNHSVASETAEPILVDANNPNSPYDNPKITADTMVGSKTVDENGLMHASLHHFNPKKDKLVADPLLDEPVSFVWYPLNKIGMPNLDNPLTGPQGDPKRGGPFTNPKGMVRPLGMEIGLKTDQN